MNVMREPIQQCTLGSAKRHNVTRQGHHISLCRLCVTAFITVPRGHSPRQFEYPKLAHDIVGMLTRPARKQAIALPPTHLGMHCTG